MKPRLVLMALALGVVLLCGVVLIACGETVSSDAGQTGVATETTDAGGATGASNTGAAAVAGTGAPGGKLTGPGYITFVVNVHDNVHIDESADTVLRLIDIYAGNGVRGDFYLTEPVARQYAQSRPDVIERLKNSGMTISYHVRPPHPLYNGFDSVLKGLDGAALAQTLLDYETYRLDMVTGGLDRDQAGGYEYVAALFGRNPVVASAPNNDSRIRAAAEKTYATLGAKMTLRYHEEGTDIKQPFVWMNGMLERPSDFSVTRWGLDVAGAVAPATRGGSGGGDSGQDPFWWNMLTTPKADQYNPVEYLQKRLGQWWAGAPGRPPLITVLIHENNLYRSGPEGWTARYFSEGNKAEPLTPPYDLNATDLSEPRSAAEQEQIWAAYEEQVAWAAANLQVVTSADIVEMAS